MHNATKIIGGISLGITPTRRSEIIASIHSRLIQERSAATDLELFTDMANRKIELFMDIANRKSDEELVILNTNFWNARNGMIP